ncbi:hypothetical protein ACP4OV_021403 [Aristida adscensionis]
METGVIVLSVVVVLFGVASAVLGFIAEARKLTPDDIGVPRGERDCVYPSNPAFVLALCAVPLLLVSQIIASAAGGCCGCCRPRAGASRPKRAIGIVASILSWIAASIAVVFYLQGAVWNVPGTLDDVAVGCYYVKAGVFTRAAVLSLVATFLGIKSYILLTIRAPPQWPAQGQGYGQPGVVLALGQL